VFEQLLQRGAGKLEEVALVERHHGGRALARAEHAQLAWKLEITGGL